jgi:xanthine/uracil/vitamin C permease (AzgA family)
MGVGPGIVVAATFGVTLALGEAVPWASKLAAIVISVSKARKDLDT